MKKWFNIVFCATLFAACSSLDKDNEPNAPLEVQAEVKAKLGVYRPLVRANLDSHGLVIMGGSNGDSALFSCLARAAGAVSFDPGILFKDGKPVRHPDHKPSATPNKTGSLGTPISKDMVSGVLWCLLDLHKRGDTDRAHQLVSAMIAFGKAHPKTFNNGTLEVGWLFCTEEDRTAYQISDTDWYGRCFMPPAIIKDIYRVAKMVGVGCDQTCQEYMVLGPNIPADKDGFERHLAVIGTARNGFVDGAINDNSLKQVLQKADEAQPRNGLYQAAYATFLDGDQKDAYTALSDVSLFPADKLPTSANYCTDYLFQRDDDSQSGEEDPDWLPCGDGSEGSEGRGVEFVFAAAMSLGELFKDE